ncbi:MAG: hypothetical protein EPO11_03605, partial [Gammaproteobacteria bacterium]
MNNRIFAATLITLYEEEIPKLLFNKTLTPHHLADFLKQTSKIILNDTFLQEQKLYLTIGRFIFMYPDSVDETDHQKAYVLALLYLTLANDDPETKTLRLYCYKKLNANNLVELIQKKTSELTELPVVLYALTTIYMELGA